MARQISGSEISGSGMTIDLLRPGASNHWPTDIPRLYDQQGNYRGKLSANLAGSFNFFGLFGSSGFFGFPIGQPIERVKLNKPNKRNEPVWSLPSEPGIPSPHYS
jgi:hypothetical protein